MNMLDEYNIFDEINFVTLVNKIVDFSKANKEYNSAIQKYDAIKNVVEEIFPFGFEERSKEINRLRKLFSYGALPENFEVLRKIVDDKKFKPKVMECAYNIESAIRDERNAVSRVSGAFFLAQLKENCIPPFFNDEEMDEIEKTYNTPLAHNSNFLGLLFVHAFRNIAITTPDLLAKRVFHEALTLSDSNPMKMKLLKCAADYGNGYAALMYANQVYKDTPTALEYFLKASNCKESESNALWEIAFMCERHKIPEELLERINDSVNIDKKINDVIQVRNKIDDRDEIPYNANTPYRDIILGYPLTINEVMETTNFIKHDHRKQYALKLYLYVAKKDLAFPKAFNSLGKILLGDYISPFDAVPVEHIDAKKLSFAKNYLSIAINLKNTNAMVNMAVYYHNQHKLFLSGAHDTDITDEEKKMMRNYFQTAANFKEGLAMRYLGEILIEEKKYTEAKECLKFAADKNDSPSCRSYGKLCVVDGKKEEAKEYFEKALKFKNYDAAYDLASLYLEKYVSSSDTLRITYLQFALHLLEENYDMMSADYKEKARIWISEWKKAII